MFVENDIEELKQTYIWKHNFSFENKVFFLHDYINTKMIVKSSSAILQKIISKNNGDYYCINCLCSFRTKNKLKTHKSFCKNHNYCYVEMAEKGKDISKI